jgi:hypothetical protein
MPRRSRKPMFALSLAAAVGLIAALAPGIATAAVPRAASVAAVQPAAAQAVQLTFIKVLCPTYTVVPANKNPTNLDATGGHGGQLDTSFQTVQVNPATDIPASCTPADGWQFQMFSSSALSTAVGAPVTTGADGTGTGSVTITLDPTELALAQTSGSPTGLWIAEIEQPGVATFGALRCNRDIKNGDNVENVRNVGVASQHIYCIAYNVAVAQVTPVPTVSPSPFQSFGGTTATPIESFAGETATAGSSATPPPTDTNGGGSDGNSTPLLAWLIGLGLGALALLGVQTQRRSIKR